MERILSTRVPASIFTLIVVCSGLVPSAPARTAARDSKTASEDRTRDAIVARLERAIPDLMQKGAIPGLAVGLVHDGKLAWHRGFGIVNAETKRLVADDTVFEAASLSKPVFAYTILKLVDAGKFDLDAPIQTYLPGSYDVGDDARLEKITARRVLSHTPGFPNWRPRGSKTLQIHFTPGERFSYSGEGFVYLARAVEKVTGEPFDRVVARLTLEPLGMKDSSFAWRDDYGERATFRHAFAGDVRGQNRGDEVNAAASLRTTAADYGRFVAAVINGTGLSKSMHEQMLSPQIAVDEGCTVCVDRPAGKQSTTISWGLGVGLQETSAGRAFWHWGDNGDAKAFVIGYPKSGTGLVLFANSTHGLSILDELLQTAFGAPQPVIGWLRYERYDSPARVFFADVLAKGAPKAIEAYRAARKSTPSATITESAINRIGYALLGLKRVEDAIEVFKLNVEDFPASFNTYDSLGEAYMSAGRKELAIANYKRSIELNPENQNGRDMLKKLEEE